MWLFRKKKKKIMENKAKIITIKKPKDYNYYLPYQTLCVRAPCAFWLKARK